MKLTKAQRACLAVLVKIRPDPNGGWCWYGTACGVKRHVVRALVARGLAELDDRYRPGVAARITEAGRKAILEGTDR